MLEIRIDKKVYGELCYFYGLNFAFDEFNKLVKEILDEKCEKEFTIGTDRIYTIETIQPFFREIEKEWMEFYNNEVSKQINYFPEKEKWLEKELPNLEKVKCFINSNNSDLSVFKVPTELLVKILLAEKGYDAIFIESNKNLEYPVYLENGKKFVITSTARLKQNGVFSYPCLEFELEEK